MGKTEAETISPPADTMRERVGYSRAKMWFLVGGNRWAVSGLLLFVTFAIIVFAGVFGSGSLSSVLSSSTVSGLFQTLFLAVVTAVALTLAIGQLILSQEMGHLGEQRGRMQDEVAFRGFVEEVAGVGVSPATPAGFLRTLIRGVEDEATRVRERLADDPETEATRQIAEFVDVVADHSQQIDANLQTAEFGTFEVTSAILDYNYSWKVRTGRRLQDKHAGVISEQANEALDDLIQNVQLFGPARQYFKLMYYQHELIDVSRVLLSTVMPALAVSLYMGFAFNMQQFSGAILGVNTAFLVISFVAMIALFPFAVLVAFTFRLITVSQRTLTIGPFILRESADAGEIKEM
jgi:hypothetical protein